MDLAKLRRQYIYQYQGTTLQDKIQLFQKQFRAEVNQKAINTTWIAKYIVDMCETKLKDLKDVKKDYYLFYAICKCFDLDTNNADTINTVVDSGTWSTFVDNYNHFSPKYKEYFNSDLNNAKFVDGLHLKIDCCKMREFLKDGKEIKEASDINFIYQKKIQTNQKYCHKIKDVDGYVYVGAGVEERIYKGFIYHKHTKAYLYYDNNVIKNMSNNMDDYFYSSFVGDYGFIILKKYLKEIEHEIN